MCTIHRPENERVCTEFAFFMAITLAGNFPGRQVTLIRLSFWPLLLTGSSIEEDYILEDFLTSEDVPSPKIHSFFPGAKLEAQD